MDSPIGMLRNSTKVLTEENIQQVRLNYELLDIAVTLQEMDLVYKIQ